MIDHHAVEPTLHESVMRPFRLLMLRLCGRLLDGAPPKGASSATLHVILPQAVRVAACHRVFSMRPWLHSTGAVDVS